AGSLKRATPQTSLPAAKARATGLATWPVGPVMRIFCPVKVATVDLLCVHGTLAGLRHGSRPVPIVLGLDADGKKRHGSWKRQGMANGSIVGARARQDPGHP